ncbi:MAG: gliding motility-associated-like protein [Flavobacteriaceae bacterium]|jgi:gliding motility-associated-like protein
MKKLLIYALPLILFAGFILPSNLSNAQCGPLSTPTITNNGQSGIMFDVVALTTVNITQFAIDFDNGTYNIEIYSIPGTHVGNETNAAAWTLVGTANAWVGVGGTNVTIPIPLNVSLCPGDVGGFYITANNATSGNYSNGTGVGNIIIADANIQILEGTGKAYPFGLSFTPRVPNVRVVYSCITGCCIPPIMSMTQETCPGACDGTATATPDPGAVPVFTYLWDAAAGGQITQTATGLCAGTYSVDMTDGAGCVSTTTIIVTSAAAGANATITPVANVCQTGLAFNMTAVDPGGTWTGIGITNGVAGTFDPMVSGLGTHTITYQIGGLCGDLQTTTVTVEPIVDATITPVGPFCFIDPTILLVGVTPGGTWTGMGITNAVTGAFDPVTAGVGTHTITYTINGACSDVQTADIIIAPSFSALITPAGPYCLDDPTVTLAGVSPGGTWTGMGITNAATGDFDPLTAGVGAHLITYSIPGVCGDIQTETITILALDNATITPVGPLCLGTTLNLSAVTGGGVWSGAGITNAALGTFDASIARPGFHTITYTTQGQCSDMATIIIEVYEALSLEASGTTPVCDGDPVSLTATGSGGDGNLNYVWTDQAGTVVGTGAALTLYPSTTTTYTVTLIDGCTTPSQNSSIIVTVYPIPTVTFVADNNLGCTPFNVVFTNTSSPMGMDCAWNFGNGYTEVGCGSVEAQFLDVGCYDVTLTVTSNGCSNSATQSDFVCVAEQPEAAFTFAPQEVDILDTEVDFFNQSANAEFFLWDFDDGMSSTVTNPIHTYSETPAGYTVCLEASNTFNCYDTVCHIVTIDDLLLYFVPNSFTPDDDELNQTFRPVFTSGFDPYDFVFRIYNRWGEVIWESQDATIGWDGTYNGKLVETGTYIWNVEFKLSNSDARTTATGHVNLLR